MPTTIAYLGKEELVLNEVGEKDKSIVFSPSYFYVEQNSVKSREFYQAMQTCLTPEISISMNKYEYYDFVQDCIKLFVKLQNPITEKWIDYTVIRSFEKFDDSVELTLARGIDNVCA